MIYVILATSHALDPATGSITWKASIDYPLSDAHDLTNSQSVPASPNVVVIDALVSEDVYNQIALDPTCQIIHSEQR